VTTESINPSLLPASAGPWDADQNDKKYPFSIFTSFYLKPASLSRLRDGAIGGIFSLTGLEADCNATRSLFRSIFDRNPDQSVTPLGNVHVMCGSIFYLKNTPHFTSLMYNVFLRIFEGFQPRGTPMFPESKACGPKSPVGDHCICTHVDKAVFYVNHRIY